VLNIDFYEYAGRYHDGTLRVFGYVCGRPVMEFRGVPYWESGCVKIFPKRQIARHSADVSPRIIPFDQIKRV
jgi:hypothetical protein